MRRDPPGETAARPASTGTPGADQVRERWPEILEAVKRERRVAWMLLSNATVDTLHDGILTLRFTGEGEARGFTSGDYGRDLGQALEKMLGLSPKIRAVSGAAREGGTGPGGGGGTSPASGGGDAAPAGSGRGGAGAGSASRGSQEGAGPGGAAAGEAGAGRGGTGNPGGNASAQAGPAAADAGMSARASRPDAGRAGRPGRAAPAPPEEPDHDPAVPALTGMDLIQRTLGGQVIEEFGDA